MIQSQRTLNRPGKRIGKYCFTRQLGKGAYGEVFEAINTDNNKQYAIKCVYRDRLRDNNGLVGELLNTEVKILYECVNPNVVKLYERLDSQNQVYLILEFCNGGDFDELWKKHKQRFSEKDALIYLKQILNGMKGLHQLRVIHRDLKLANLLLHDGSIKIADLGFAKQLDHNEQQVQLALGSLGNMAPEVLEMKPYGIQADMFSIGTIYYLMLYGKFPFSIRSYEDFKRDVKQNSPNLDDPDQNVSEQSKEILRMMLCYDPNRRIKFADLYKHPLISANQNIMDSISLSYLAIRKIDIKENEKMYEENEVKMIDQKDLKNQMLNIAENQSKNQEQTQFIETQNFESITPSQDERIDEDFLQQIRQIQDLEQKNHDEVMKVINQYLAKRNKLVFLARTIEQQQRVTHHLIITNVILPAFILMKKLINESRKLIKSVESESNIFHTSYLKQVYLNQHFENFYKILQDDVLLFSDQYEATYQQCMDELPQMKDVTPDQKKVIINDFTDRFEDVYQDTLLNYYFQLQEEYNKEQQEYQKSKKKILQIILLECLGFDKFLDQQMMAPDFSLDSYFEKLERMSSNEMDQVIQQKYDQVFI